MRAALQEAFTFRLMPEETEEVVDTTTRANTKDATLRVSTFEEDPEDEEGNFENLYANDDGTRKIDEYQ
jgi:hypothetical protein